MKFKNPFEKIIKRDSATNKIRGHRASIIVFDEYEQISEEILNKILAPAPMELLQKWATNGELGI